MGLELKMYKNYKELALAMEWKQTNGKGRTLQLEDLERYCTYYKEGNKFIIDKIFEEPKEKQPVKHKRNPNKAINRKFKITREIEEHIGVYKIYNEYTREIYIGSTITGFRIRYQQHYYNGKNSRMKHTYKLLSKTKSKFDIIEDMIGMKEDIIRRREAEYIEKYKQDKNWNLINRKEETYILDKKIKYKTLKVRVQEDEYDQAMQLLIDSGFIKEEEEEETIYLNNSIEKDFDINNIEF